MILNFVLGNRNSAKLRSASVTVISLGLGQCRHAPTNDPTINRDVSAFADDLELCSWQPKLCQAQISICDRYLSWSRTMQARPNK